MLSQFYPPTLGGEEQHVHALSTSLAARGHSTSVATLWRPGLPEIETDKGVTVYRIRGVAQRIPWAYQESDRRHTPPVPDPELAWHLRTVVMRERPDIVHAHNWMVHSFLPLKSMSRSKLVLTLHDYSLICAQKRLMYEHTPCSGPGAIKCLRCCGAHYGTLKGMPIAAANWVMSLEERRSVDWFLAVSQAVADRNRLPVSRTEVVPNLVPDELGNLQGNPPPELDQLPQGDFILFAGDLSADKGVPVLLAAYAKLSSPPPLVLLGRRCADTPTTLPPGARMFFSWPRRSVLWAWSRCMLAVVPSVWEEPWGTVAVEAMVMGKPVIASRFGGLPDLVADGLTGLLVPPGDIEALRAALARILNDRDERERMGRAALKHATRFYVSSVVPRIEQVYRSLMQQEPRAGQGSELAG